METRRLILSVLGLMSTSVPVAAEVAVFRPGPCAANTSYLLAANSGALIRVTSADGIGFEDHIIMFRYQPTDGWASQRLLRRFDLQLDDHGTRISNSGVFCVGGR